MSKNKHKNARLLPPLLEGAGGGFFKKIRKGIEMTGQFYLDELRNIRRDAGALLILVGAMIIYPLAYSIGYKNEVVRELKTTIVDLDRTTTSHQLIKMLEGAEQVEINRVATSLDEAKNDFFEGNSGGIHLSSNIAASDGSYLVARSDE